MFIASQFTIGKILKQCKCPSTNNGCRRCGMEYLKHNGILLSHKKEWNNVSCSNIDTTTDYHTMWSKSERKRQILHDIAYM